MAAGLGFKTFTTGEVLTAGDVNGYLMQGVLVFATAAARNSAITSPQEGQFAFTKDTNGLWYYDGAAWVASGATGDIEGVTAGVGITGGGTSGTVTVTNDMATTITTAGDLIKGTGSGTYNRLGIGSTGQVLTVASGAPSWATPASGSTFVGARCLLVAQISAVANNTRQVINWTAEDYNTNSIHSLVTNTSRLTVPSGYAGKWGISTTALWASSTSGYRQMFIYKNGSAVAVSSNPAGAGDFGLSLWNGVLALAAADYIEIYALQNSGTTKDLYGNNSDTGVTAVNFYYLGA